MKRNFSCFFTTPSHNIYRIVPNNIFAQCFLCGKSEIINEPTDENHNKIEISKCEAEKKLQNNNKSTRSTLIL